MLAQVASVDDKKAGRKLFIRFIAKASDEVAVTQEDMQAAARTLISKSSNSGAWGRARLPLSQSPSSRVFQAAQQLATIGQAAMSSSRRARRQSICSYGRTPPSEIDVAPVKKQGVRFAEGRPSCTVPGILLYKACW